MAFENVKGFLLALLRMLPVDLIRISFIFVSNNLLPALVEVNVTKDEILHNIKSAACPSHLPRLAGGCRRSADRSRLPFPYSKSKDVTFQQSFVI